MKKELIEQMLTGVDKKYIQEAIEEEEKENFYGRKTVIKVRKLATVAAVCILVIGVGVSVGAATSSVFRNWVRENFFGYEITKVDLPKKGKSTTEQKETEEKNITVDIPLDANAHISLAENMEIYGEKESFVCQYHIEDEEQVVDQVYAIQDNGLKKLEAQNFYGKYDGADFSFQYVILNQEIFAFNSTGDINGVFHYINDDNVYAQLCHVEEDTFVKGCIARLNLKTGTVTKLTNDKTLGNMKMSPNGKIILINYRADGYWSAFDLANCTEKRIDEIHGYAHLKEVVFKGDYQVLTYGDDYMKGDVIMTGTQLIDLRTGKRIASYKKCGDYDPEWLYKQKKGKLKIQNVDGTTAFSIDTEKDFEGYPHPLSSRGDYVLLGNLEEQDTPYYLCNLKKETYMKIDAFSGFDGEVGLYLAAKEGKILLTDGKEAYLVTINNLLK